MPLTQSIAELEAASMWDESEGENVVLEASQVDNVSDLGQLVEGGVSTWHLEDHLVLPLLMVVGVVGNVLVIYVYQGRWPRSQTAHFKKMLATIDLCALTLLCPALMLMSIAPDHVFYSITCMGMAYLKLVVMTTTGFVLLMIAVDGYLKTCHPHSPGLIRSTRNLLLVLSLLTSGFLSLPSLWLFGQNRVIFHGRDVFMRYCYIQESVLQEPVFLLHLGLFWLVYLFICCPFLALYYNIWAALRGPPPRVSAEGFREFQSYRRSFAVFLTVTLVYVACFTPYLVWLVVIVVEPSIISEMTPLTKAFFDLARLCPLLNCMAKPCIYGYYSVHFRREVKLALKLRSSPADPFKSSISIEGTKFAYFDPSV